MSAKHTCATEGQRAALMPAVKLPDKDAEVRGLVGEIGRDAGAGDTMNVRRANVEPTAAAGAQIENCLTCGGQ